MVHVFQTFDGDIASLTAISDNTGAIIWRRTYGNNVDVTCRASNRYDVCLIRDYGELPSEIELLDGATGRAVNGWEFSDFVGGYDFVLNRLYVAHWQRGEPAKREHRVTIQEFGRYSASPSETTFVTWRTDDAESLSYFQVNASPASSRIYLGYGNRVASIPLALSQSSATEFGEARVSDLVLIRLAAKWELWGKEVECCYRDWALVSPTGQQYKLGEGTPWSGADEHPSLSWSTIGFNYASPPLTSSVGRLRQARLAPFHNSRETVSIYPTNGNKYLAVTNLDQVTLVGSGNHHSLWRRRIADSSNVVAGPNYVLGNNDNSYIVYDLRGRVVAHVPIPKSPPNFPTQTSVSLSDKGFLVVADDGRVLKYRID